MGCDRLHYDIRSGTEHRAGREQIESGIGQAGIWHAYRRVVAADERDAGFPEAMGECSHGEEPRAGGALAVDVCELWIFSGSTTRTTQARTRKLSEPGDCNRQKTWPDQRTRSRSLL